MASPITRKEYWQQQFPAQPNYRWLQVEQATFNDTCTSYAGISNLPLLARTTLEEHAPWMSLQEVQTVESKRGDTYKAVVETIDHKRIETVLMENRRGQWTICVSSQVGCAMRCQFCATGKMGFTRNLTVDEIVDQYRFWMYFLSSHERGAPRPPKLLEQERRRISNVVFMGMGEPLANYENVREVLEVLLRNTDLGPTHITVSTVGMLPKLEEILNDPRWPHVRLAVSVHSADPVTRKAIVPTSYDNFLEKLADWAKRYLEKFGNRRHHLTFEYVMLSGVNDDDRHAKALAAFVQSVGYVKVNLIPYNATGASFERSTHAASDRFVEYLTRKGIVATKRKTMGDDIAAACGQLIVEVKSINPARQVN